jgi:nucleotide-binding universal stress UspA family protein
MKKKFEIKKILVPTDFSETAAHAVRQAVVIAKQKDAILKLMHVINPVYITGSELTVPYGPAFFNKLQKTAMTHLKKIAVEINKTNGIEVEYDVRMGGIESVINTIAKKEKFDLIVMGTHGTSGLKEFFVGSNTYKVVHKANCPILSVQKKLKGAFKNIVLPIRIEIASRQNVDYAVEFARLFGATIHIAGFTSLGDKNSKNKINAYVKQVETYLQKKEVNFTSTSIFANNFNSEIQDYAKKVKGDLIVIINDHDFSVDQLFIGDYTKRFVNHSDIPILSVPVMIETSFTFSPALSG